MPSWHAYSKVGLGESATGTAAVVSPIGEIGYMGEDIPVGEGETGPLARRLYDEIVGIQYGYKDDPFGWRVRIA